MSFGATIKAESEPGLIVGAETIDLQSRNSNGILLLHGFGDTPQTLDLLARELHSAGYDVRAPLLPGHGENVAAFAASRRSDWLDHARRELEVMQASHARVSLVGLSMGGALAAILAADNRTTPALVLLAPYMEMPITYRMASVSHWLWGGVAGTRPTRNRGSIFDPAEREKNLGYGVYSGRLLYELWRLCAAARQSLPSIITPTLLMQSPSDPRISPAVAERTVAALGTSDKRLVWVQGAGHIITVDYGRGRVFHETVKWIAKYMPATA
ncbi:MAG: alpha/beta fold hydrolase [Gemmatimonadaceae bacterium]|nr:alpha/beta fold hydrolase [Gemmatimonadaceae bacterium]